MSSIGMSQSFRAVSNLIGIRRKADVTRTSFFVIDLKETSFAEVS
jgi:hypothetical protein